MWLKRVIEKAIVYCQHFRRFLIMGNDINDAITIINDLDHPRHRCFGFLSNDNDNDDNANDNDNNDDSTSIINDVKDIIEGSVILNDDSNGNDTNDDDYNDVDNVVILNNEDSNISTQSSSSSSTSTSLSSEKDNENDDNNDNNNDYERYVKVKKHVKYYIALGQQEANVSTDGYNMSVQAFNMLQLAIEGKIMDAFLNTDERSHPAFLHIERLHNDDDDNNNIKNVTPLITKDSNDSLIEVLKIEQHQSVTLLDALRNNHNITNELHIKDNKIKELEALLILEREANANLKKRKNTTTNNIEDISDGSDENCDTNNISTKKLKTEKNI